jgi:hypothetical protein
MISFLVQLVLFTFTAAVSWWLISPHFRTFREAADPSRERAVSEEQDRQLQALQDLELDYFLQHISESEYKRMKQGLLGEKS